MRWQVTPFKIKFLRKDGSLKTAVEASFSGYELKEGAMLSPSSRSWKHDVSTLYTSWKGRNAELTLRSLIRENYPSAVKLQDIIGVQPKERLTKAGNSDDKAVQTKDRIYTFPIPMPTTLTTESVTWGEAEIKTAVMSPGELWHARFGHVGDMCMKETSDKYPMFNIPKKHVTNPEKQAGTCECCARCKATVTRKVKSSYHRATRYLERVHMDVCGPLQMKTYDGCQYFTVFIDEYTGYRWVYIHKDRTTSVENLRRFLLDATKGTDLRVECLMAKRMTGL